MNRCLTCSATTQLYLCENCETQLANMLDQIPWLLTELDNRVQNLARISTGTIGRNRRADELNIIDFDAADRARTIRQLLTTWVRDIAQRHLGRQPANLHYVTTGDLARWLRINVHHIANDDRAGKLYNDIRRLVGADHRGGELVRAINPVEHHLVGPCPTITGRHHDGTPRQCGHMLFADTYDRTVDCPSCQQTIDVRATRERAAAERDLHTRAGLAEILTNIDEPVDPTRIDQWIKARRLRPRGWFHRGAIVQLQIDDSDEPAYSVERARRLRRRDTHLRNRTRGAART